MVKRIRYILRLENTNLVQLIHNGASEGRSIQSGFGYYQTPKKSDKSYDRLLQRIHKNDLLIIYG